MNKNNQHSAQALGDDTLENVSGGYQVGYQYRPGKYFGDPGNLSYAQQKKLESYGIRITKEADNPGLNWGSMYPPPSHYVFTDGDGNNVSDKIITELLSS